MQEPTIFPSRLLLLINFVLLLVFPFVAPAQDAEHFLIEHPIKGNPMRSTEYRYLPGKEPNLIEIDTWKYGRMTRNYSRYSVLEQRYLTNLGINNRFDSLQRLREQDIYDLTQPNPPLAYRIHYYYDSLNRPIYIEGTDPNRHHEPFEVFTTHKESGAGKTDTFYVNGRKGQSITNINDRFGLLIRQERRAASGDLLETRTFSYNENGDLLTDVVTDNKSHITSSWSYTYDFYDKAGNWLKQTKYNGGKIVSVIQRIVEYYRLD